MKKPKNLVAIVGIAYAIAIAGLATGNILHNYFGEKGNTGNHFDPNGFGNLEETSIPSSIPSSKPSSSVGSLPESSSSKSESKPTPESKPTQSKPIESSSNTPIGNLEPVHTLAQSPYTQTIVTPSLNNYANDSRGYNIKYYTVDIKLKKISDLRTYLVTDETGHPGDNVTDIVSNQVRTVEAGLNTNVLAAISGDSAFSYNHRPGYVIRNGSIIRDTRRNSDDATNKDAIIWKDGTMSSIWEADYSPEDLIARGALQNWMFGPDLIVDSRLAVTPTSEIVSETMAQGGNQRCAIGYLGPFHFVFMVSQGRKQQNRDGFTLHDMAQILLDYGCTYAYNLDGGGSATIVARVEDDPSPVKKYPQENSQRPLGDMIYVVDL